MKVISLFSGVGGSSLGYEMAGFEVIAANEFINYQAHNYRLNHSKTKMYEQDIRTLDPVQVMKDLNLKEGELDVLDGSPPCVGFSTAGVRQEHWGKKVRYSSKEQRTDDLFYEYIRFLNILKPKVFVAENVSGLLKGPSKGYFIDILSKMKSAGYNVKAKLLNAVNYSVPQLRQRVFFIGVRNDLNKEPVYPTPHGKIVNLQDAFKGLEHSAAELAEADISRFALHAKLKSLRQGEAHAKRFNLVKCSPYKPAQTLVQSAKEVGLPSICHWDNRKFTVKECMRITSFPDDFKLEGTYANKVEACGRTVPPLMMKAIAETIKKEIFEA